MKITIELDTGNPFEKQDAKDCLELLETQKAELGMNDSDCLVLTAIINELQRLNPK